MGSTLYNNKTYDNPLPCNDAILNTGLTQPHDKNLSYVTLKRWEAADKQILRAEFLDSFWTLLYSWMWFDVELKFLYFTDPDNKWWYHYYCWIRGEEPLPAETKKFCTLTRFSGFWLITWEYSPC